LALGPSSARGDEIDFVVTARDPEDLPLEYRLEVVGHEAAEWQATGLFSLEVKEAHIGTLFVHLAIRSPRSYHLGPGYDQQVVFAYRVLPRRS